MRVLSTCSKYRFIRKTQIYDTIIFKFEINSKMQKYTNILNICEFNRIIKSIQTDDTKSKQLLKEVYLLKQKKESMLIRGSKLLDTTTDQVN